MTAADKDELDRGSHIAAEEIKQPFETLQIKYIPILTHVLLNYLFLFFII